MLKATRVFVLISVVVTFLVCSVRAVPKVSRVGRYLYNADGSRFYIKGIAYQEQGTVVASADNPFGEPSSFIDPLAQGDACARDIPFLSALGVNSIRVYSVDSSLNHDACMNAFSQAGIYTIIDLALPLNGSIDRVSPSWSTNLLNQYIATIDAFSKYDNVLAYNVGNEVVLQDGTGIAPFVKAAARDIRAYLSAKKSSALVGYAAINGAANWRDAMANYLSCDPSSSNSGATAIDLYGLNDYEWCGDSTFQASYAGTTGDYAGYNVAAYFSEFGCITSPPRLWTESGAIFSSDMAPVWSGGIAFSYFPATSAQGQFGMVTISADGKTVTTSDDYDRLKTQYGLVSPPNSPAQASATAAAYPTCPTANSTFLASTVLPPTPNQAACGCLENALSCQFTPSTSNYSAIAGTLLDTGCNLLGQAGGSCLDIGGNGTTGIYGRVSDCDPTVKLSYVMSQYYEANKRNAQACSFAGNGTVNPHASSSVSAVAVASSCISNPSATFAPTAAATAGAHTSTSSVKGSNASNAVGNTHAVGGFIAMTFIGLASVVLMLA